MTVFLNILKYLGINGGSFSELSSYSFQSYWFSLKGAFSAIRECLMLYGILLTMLITFHWHFALVFSLPGFGIYLERTYDCFNSGARNWQLAGKKREELSTHRFEIIINRQPSCLWEWHANHKNVKAKMGQTLWSEPFNIFHK